MVPLFSLALGEILWRREVRHIRNSHTRYRCRACPMRVIIPERSSLRNALRIVKMLILMGRLEGPVCVEVLHHHQERLREPLHPLDRKIRRDVGLVSFVPLLFNNVAAQLRIPEITFSLVVRTTRSLFENKIVEPHISWIRGKMPLAHDAGLITVLLQKFRHGYLTLVESRSRLSADDLNSRIGNRAIDMAIGAGEQRRSTGPTERVRRKRVAESYAFIRDAIDVRGVDELASVAA